MRGAIGTLRSPQTREFLLWCLPALLLGLALRVVLTVHMPYGFYHDDAPDFLTTADSLINHHRLDLHAKKTFLVPTLFTVPFLVGVPALIAIPIFQHLLGLALLLVVGLLCRLWFARWRVFILPITVLMAVNPFLLWYEHTLMAETVFVFATTLVALAGTLYALEQSRVRFVFLLVALFLTAGARPEGKLLFAFGLFLVALLHARAWRTEWRRIAIILALALVTHILTRTEQAGLLLYTSVARFTPTSLTSAPGIEPYIAPVREELNQRWEQTASFPRVSHRRQITSAVTRYLKDQPNYAGKVRHDLNRLSLKMAAETCRRNLFSLPAHAFNKFAAVATEPPSDWLNNRILFDKQRHAYADKTARALKISEGLTGEKIADEAALNHFVDTHYGEVPWFNIWQSRWLAVVNHLRFPDRVLPNPDHPNATRLQRGLPFYFLVAVAGLAAVAFRRGVLQPFHIAWGTALVGFFFLLMLAANVRPRFRFVFEPFWFIYIAFLVEMIWLAMAARIRRA